ncbi:MAG: cell division protein SepF [Actinomycetes bacterium]
MSMFRRAMDYLGLGPDDAYDDYDASVAVERPLPRRRPEPRGRMVRQEEEYDDYEEYEDDIVDQRAPRAPRGMNTRAPQLRDDSSVQVRPSTSGLRAQPTVRPLSANSAQPVEVRPTRYDQAKEVADLFKSGNSVLLNIGSADSDVARRLLDFTSGLIYGMQGTMEKVSPGVFLIKPFGASSPRG